MMVINSVVECNSAVLTTNSIMGGYKTAAKNYIVVIFSR